MVTQKSEYNTEIEVPILASLASFASPIDVNRDARDARDARIETSISKPPCGFCVTNKNRGK